LRGGLDAVKVRHGDVHDYNVGKEFLSHSYGVAPVNGFANDLKAFILLELQPQAFADDAMVVRNKDANFVHAAIPAGSWT
jgi:hypothetical protein